MTACKAARVAALLILIVALFSQLMVPTVAGSITFRDLGYTNKTISVTTMENGDTTSTHILGSNDTLYTLPDASYILVLKNANSSSYTSTPVDLLNYILDNIVQIAMFLIGVMVLAFVVFRISGGKRK